MRPKPGLYRAPRRHRAGGKRRGRCSSVVGFDDIPEAAHSLPPLTTMRQAFEALGRDAMSPVPIQCAYDG
ncbi:substrate-binding domain-containing protein [Microbacterium sp.]|uniref:substrate-binding domain-containing protein n=1 Tax=Microbacterium sp. TaxID=51671 RepID=UPI0039C93566